MKSFLSYSLIIFFMGIFFFPRTKDVNISTSSHQNVKLQKEVVKDTFINKLPNGYRYISNFKLKNNKKVFAISQDNEGIMIFLTGKSVVFFDGKVNTELYIDNIPNTLKKDKKLNQFYIACKEGFGVLKKNAKGNYIYETISDINTIDNFTNLLVSENKVWFISKHKIVSINPNNISENKIEYFNRERIISGAFVYNKKIYFSEYKRGLQLLENGTTKLIIADSLFKKAGVVFSVKNNNNSILGLEDNKIYNFDGKTYSKKNISSEDYIKESIIFGGLDYNKNMFAVLTLNGGAILINKKTGKTSSTINYRTGLPDDEIFAAKKLKNGSLWLSHDYGISRVAFDIPLSNYEYPGLQGKINTFKVFDSTLYVGTGEGLFKLTEIKSFEEVEIATTKKLRSRVKSKVKNIKNTPKTKTQYSKNEDIISEDKLEEDTEENTGFFSRWKKRLRRKKEKDKIENIQEDNIQENNIDEVNVKKKKKSKKKRRKKWYYKTVYKDVVEYRKIYELQSVKYSYKKIDGISSKCKQLTNFSNGLLVASNSGLFYIINNEVKTIINDTYVYNISVDSNDKTAFVSTSKGIFKVFNTIGRINAKKVIDGNIRNITLKNIYKESDTSIWCNAFNVIYNYKLEGSKVVSFKKFVIKNDQIEKLKIINNKDTLFFFTSNNVFYYDELKQKLLLKKDYNYIFRKSDNLFSINDTSLILTSNKSIVLSLNNKKTLENIKYAWLFNNIEKIYTDDDDNIWLLTSDNLIYKIDKNNLKLKNEFKVSIKRISDDKGLIYNNFQDLNLENNYKSIIVELSSPHYIKNDFIKYSYAIDNNNQDKFIEYSGSKIEIPELKIGDHIIYFQATNSLNEKSKMLFINVKVKPPFWQTSLFIGASFFVILVLIALLISNFYRRKQRKINEYNQILEAKVKERTKEILEQNRLIKEKNSEIYNQYKKINYQNEEITGSIRYAGRIQKAALPNTEIQTKYISGYFNLFKPRDIVSGDFYWMSEAQNKLFIAAVDCTGHGVPGGFLSMLGISFLNEIVRELGRDDNIIKASTVLNILRKKIINTLSQQGDSITRDGMDMALTIIDKENMELDFAGANNSAYIIRNSKLTKIDADRMPIGYNRKFNNVSFTNKTIKIEEGDLIYLFSDGFADQFGGNFDKKFNSRRFREMLSHLEKFSMEKQKQIAEAILNKWKGANEQIDDILLIGIKI